MKPEVHAQNTVSKRRFTPEGNAEVEKRLAKDQYMIAAAVTALIPTQHFCALVLIGGYARGEGGFVFRDGKAAPFNDYDYFLVVKDMSNRAVAALRPSLAQLAEALSSEVGVEVDLEILRSETLHKSRPSLMFAEMLWGHKVVAGDTRVLDSMPAMPFEALPLGEFTRLMLNRGALLLLNQQAINTHSISTLQQREQFIKYLFKSMLACGDAILAARGQYHPSYKEKWQRLQNLEALPERFLQHYQLALNAKFRPEFEAFSDTNLVQWQTYFVTTWRQCLSDLESKRLGRPIQHWRDYASPGIDKGQSSGNMVALLRNMAITLRDYGASEVLTNIRWSLRYPRERLISILPCLLGEQQELSETEMLSALGTITGEQKTAMETIFLAQWHRYS